MSTPLSLHGLNDDAPTYTNLAPAALIEQAVSRGEGVLSMHGAFCAVTAPYTGRSPNDKFIVREPSSESRVWCRYEAGPGSRLHGVRIPEQVRAALGAPIA